MKGRGKRGEEDRQTEKGEMLGKLAQLNNLSSNTSPYVKLTPTVQRHSSGLKWIAGTSSLAFWFLPLLLTNIKQMRREDEEEERKEGHDHDMKSRKLA